MLLVRTFVWLVRQILAGVMQTAVSVGCLLLGWNLLLPDELLLLLPELPLAAMQEFKVNFLGVVHVGVGLRQHIGVQHLCYIGTADLALILDLQLRPGVSILFFDRHLLVSNRDLMHVQVLSGLLLGLDLVLINPSYWRHDVSEVDLLRMDGLHPHGFAGHYLIAVRAQDLVVVLHLLLF